MRLWSIHPKYLDTKGIVALWREALLAKHVLEGKTKGYKNHPQLNRFKDSGRAVDFINLYLCGVWLEANERGYNFDRNKIDWGFTKDGLTVSNGSLTVTNGQMEFERAHLLRKLKVRDVEKFRMVEKTISLEAHPLFKVEEGEIEDWEII